MRMHQALGVLLIVVSALAPGFAVAAVECPTICSTPRLYGISDAAANYRLCECTSPPSETSAVRTGLSCFCDVCYRRQGSIVVGYGKEADGNCKDGDTDCGACSLVAESTTPTTTVPAPVKSTASPPPQSPPLPPQQESKDTSSGDNTLQIVFILLLVAAITVVFLMTIYWYKRMRSRRPKQRSIDSTLVVYVHPLDENGNAPLPNQY